MPRIYKSVGPASNKATAPTSTKAPAPAPAPAPETKKPEAPKKSENGGEK